MQGPELQLPGEILAGAILVMQEPDNPLAVPHWAAVRIDPRSAEWDLVAEDAKCGRFSPDTRSVALYRLNDPGPHEIGLLDLKRHGTPRRLLKNGGTPVWAPDGSQLLVSVSENLVITGDQVTSTCRTWRLDPRQGAAASPAAIPEGHRVFDWSPDGTWLATETGEIAQEDLRDRIWHMRADGSERRLIAADAARPRISPDGRHVAYQSLTEESIRIAALDGQEAWTVFHDPQCYPILPCWSPDGQWLAMVVFDYRVDEHGEKYITSDPRDARIVLMDPRGANRRELRLPARDRMEVWTCGEMDWRQLDT